MRSSLKFNRISAADAISALNGLSGFIAVIFFVNDLILAGSLFVALSVLLDGFDGVAARKYGVRHEKGPQIDSIADTVSFCVAPATALYSAFYVPGAPYSPLSLLTVLASALIVFMGIVRLGTFCDEGHLIDHFSGLPTPAAAMVVLSSILVFREKGIVHSPYTGVGLAVVISMAMVLKIDYPKARGRLALISGLVLSYFIISALLLLEGVESVFLSVSPVFLLLSTALYAVLGPVYCSRIRDKSSCP